MKREIELFTKSNSIPKIDLRVNLSGSIRKTTLVQLLSPQDQEELEKCFSKITPETPYIFSDISSRALKDIETVKRVTKEILEDWNKHNVIYMELLTKLFSQKDKYTKEEFLSSVLEEIDNSNKTQRITTRLIISLDKNDSINDYEEIFKIYQNISNPELKKLVVGIDFSGNNNNNSSRKFQEIIPIFEKFRGLGLGISVHVGENQNYEMFPLESFVPDRISQGNFLKQEHINKIFEKNIPIEICPTESYKICRCTDYSQIPMKNFWNKKFKKEDGQESSYKNICINSDVRTLIFTDISQEYYEIGISFNLGLNDLKDIEINSLNFIFEKDDSLRQKLKTKLDNYYC